MEHSDSLLHRTVTVALLASFYPTDFLISLILPVLISFIWPPLGLVAILSILGYLFVIGTISGMLSYKQGLHFGYLLMEFSCFASTYGWGSLSGLISLPFITDKK